MEIQKNILLKEYTTFRTGGCAKYFSVIKNIEDLKQATFFAKQKKLPVFVLGGGSNLLVSDKGVNGLVLKMEIKGLKIMDRDRTTEERSGVSSPVSGSESDFVQVIASAGEIWDEFVEKTIEKNLYGLENLSYIPGTVGASVVQNIGAYGVEVKDFVDWVEVFDTQTGKIKKITGIACDFGYRDSIFKKQEGKSFVVLRVAYNLKKNGEVKTNYKDIQRLLMGGDRTTAEHGGVSSPVSGSELNQMREIIIQIRQNKLPDWKKIGTAGSFFKNPIITKEQLDKLLKKYPKLPHYNNRGVSDTPRFKIPLAYVLDKVLGLKGLKEEGVGLYEKQPLVLVKYGDCGDLITSANIKNFAQKIQKEVKQKTGLGIEPEVVMW